MFYLSTIVALSMLVGVTFNSLKLMNSVYCQEQKAYETYKYIHTQLNAKIGNNKKRMGCRTDGLFQSRIVVKNLDNKFSIKYKSNRLINIDMKQKLIRDEKIIKNSSK